MKIAAGHGASGSGAQTLVQWYCQRMIEFHTAAHNPLRDGPPLRETTMLAHADRVKRFVQWCEQGGYIGDPVSLCANAPLVSKYLDHLAQKDVVTGSRARVCDSIISLLKAIFANPMCSPPWVPVAMHSVKTMRNSLQAAYEIELKARSNRVTLAEQGKWASWTDILSASKSIVREFEELHWAIMADPDHDWSPGVHEASALRRCAAACQDAVIACMYTCIPPGRGLEMRTLILRRCNAQPDPKQCENLLTTDGVGQWILRLTHHKTSGTLGTCEVPLPINKQITGAIDLWATKYRRVVLAGARHDYCFVRSSGTPFDNSSQWTNMLVSIFQPRLGARISVNSLRKAFVSHTWPTATLEERESNASAMRHGYKTAERNYEASTSRDKVSVAVQRAAQMWESSSNGSGAPMSPVETRAAWHGQALVQSPVEAHVEAPKESPKESSVASPIVPRRSKRNHDALRMSSTSPSPDSDECESESNDSDTDSKVGIVDSLLRSRKHRGQFQYLVRWTDTSETWEPESNLPQQCIREFWAKQIARAGKRTKR